MKYVLVLALIAPSAHARLIENGEAFTGKYKVRETSCMTETFDYETGKKVLVNDFTFTGTPEGLIDNGNLQQIQKHDLSLAGPDSGVTVNADYISETEFYSEAAIHFEKSGIPADFITVYYRLSGDQLTVGRTRRHPQSPNENQDCHFVRVGK
jgi:hypothetical protein